MRFPAASYAAADMSWTPMLLLTLVAAGLVWLGLEGFRRRDLETK